MYSASSWGKERSAWNSVLCTSPNRPIAASIAVLAFSNSSASREWAAEGDAGLATRCAATVRLRG